MAAEQLNCHQSCYNFQLLKRYMPELTLRVPTAFTGRDGSYLSLTNGHWPNLLKGDGNLGYLYVLYESS